MLLTLGAKALPQTHGELSMKYLLDKFFRTFLEMHTKSTLLVQNEFLNLETGVLKIGEMLNSQRMIYL